MTLVTLLLAIVSTSTPVANAHDPSKNAALQYWSALVYIPADSRQTLRELAHRHAFTAPLEDAEFLFSKSGISSVSQSALEDLRRGAAMPYCNWGMENKGPYAPAHHVQRSSPAIGLLLLQARLEYSRKNPITAIDNLNVAWTFSRHLAFDGTLAGWFADLYEVEHRLAPLTAAWIPKLDHAATLRMRDALEKLPPSRTLHELGQAEKELWFGWIKTSLDRRGPEWLLDELPVEESLKQQLVPQLTVEVT